MKNVPASDHSTLEQLETAVRTELIKAETGHQEPEACGVAAEQVPDPDAERYEIALGALLGAVEALEEAPGESSAGPQTAGG
jgi:hypothetical protein